MTPEELIEAEAEYRFNEFVEDCWIAGDMCVAASWTDLTTNPLLTIKANDYIRKYWRDRALAHFKALNSWGVRMINPYTDPDWSSKDRMRVRPLPEAQTLKAMTFNQAIVELGKAHRTEAK